MNISISIIEFLDNFLEPYTFISLLFQKDFSVFSNFIFSIFDDVCNKLEYVRFFLLCFVAAIICSLLVIFFIYLGLICFRPGTNENDEFEFDEDPHEDNDPNNKGKDKDKNKGKDKDKDKDKGKDKESYEDNDPNNKGKEKASDYDTGGGNNNSGGGKPPRISYIWEILSTIGKRERESENKENDSRKKSKSDHDNRQNYDNTDESSNSDNVYSNPQSNNRPGESSSWYNDYSNVYWSHREWKNYRNYSYLHKGQSIVFYINGTKIEVPIINDMGNDGPNSHLESIGKSTYLEYINMKNFLSYGYGNSILKDYKINNKWNITEIANRIEQDYITKRNLINKIDTECIHNRFLRDGPLSEKQMAKVLRDLENGKKRQLDFLKILEKENEKN